MTSIGYGTFSGCSSLTSIELPSVSSIGDYAFHGCKSLTSLELPSSVTYIGLWAFSECNGLESLFISSPFMSVEDYAFFNCSGLKNVVCYAEVPPAIDRLLTKYNVTLYVPSTSVDAYKTSQYVWGKFRYIKPLDEYDAIDLAKASTYDTPATIYTLDGVRVSGSVSSLKSGIYVIRQGGKVRKVMVK
jgi:hypothetical protein